MKFLLLLPLCALLSCGPSKDLGEDPIVTEQPEEDTPLESPIEENMVPPNETEIPAHNVKINLTHFHPYCGGAAPSPEIIKRQTQLLANTAFILLNLETNKKETVQSNSQGVLYLKLSQGRYALREKFKDCTFEEFQQQNPVPNGMYFQPSPEKDCYKTWWASNLGEFTISASNEVQEFFWSTSESCFTGINPCVIYTGPYPP